MSGVLIICLQNSKTKADKSHNEFTVLSNVNRSPYNKAAQNSVLLFGF